MYLIILFGIGQNVSVLFKVILKSSINSCQYVLQDSFCVDETEVSDEAEPSVLEIAEQILEDRRKGKKRRKRILKYSSSSDSECEEDVHLKNSVKKNESTCSNEQSLICLLYTSRCV